MTTILETVVTTDLPADSTGRDPIVAKYFATLPANPQDFFLRMEKAFKERLEAANLKAQRAEGRSKKADGGLGRKLLELETFVGEQREVINNLNAELQKAQPGKPASGSTGSGTTEIGRLSFEIAFLKKEIRSSRDYRSALKNRETQIDGLHAHIKTLKTQLQEAMNYDVRAELETQRAENKFLRSKVDQTTEDGAKALQEAQEAAQSKHQTLYNSSKALESRNEDLQREIDRLARENRKLAEEYDRLQK